jgi:hypothetical protein
LSELLDEAYLADVGAAKFRCSVFPVSVVSGCGVDTDRPLVVFVREQERFLAAGDAERIVSGGEQGAADPATGVVGMNEQKEHLAVVWMGSGVANDAVAVVLRDQQHVWLRVVGHEPIPVLCPEHRLVHEIAKVGPADADRGVEHRRDRRRISRNGGTYRDQRGPKPVMAHVTPPRALGKRV